MMGMTERFRAWVKRVVEAMIFNLHPDGTMLPNRRMLNAR